MVKHNYGYGFIELSPRMLFACAVYGLQFTCLIQQIDMIPRCLHAYVCLHARNVFDMMYISISMQIWYTVMYGMAHAPATVAKKKSYGLHANMFLHRCMHINLCISNMCVCVPFLPHVPRKCVHMLPTICHLDCYSFRWSYAQILALRRGSVQENLARFCFVSHVRDQPLSFCRINMYQSIF